MQPPLKRRPRQRGGHGGQAVTATVEAPKHQREVVPYQPGGGDGACGLANSDGAAEKPVAVLSGKLSRCMPLFSPSSDMVFSACSSTVLALSVDTGEELFRLVGHRKDVTGMILLPKGTYGASAGGGRGGAANIRLLTSSLDKQLRLWDISADVMSLEGELERCLRVFPVGMAIHHLYLGRTDNSGAALDVIVVTRGGEKKQKKTDSSRSQDKSDGSGHVKASSSQAPSKEIKNKTLDDDDAMNDSNSEGSSDQGDLTDQEEESDGEDTASDSDGRRDDPVGERVAKKPVTGDEGRDRDSLRTVLVKSGRHSSGSQRRGSSTWQVVRYGLAKAEAETVLAIRSGGPEWVGAVAARSPIRQEDNGNPDGKRKKGGEEGAGVASAPVVLMAKRRVVMAVDVGSGDSVLLLRAKGPVTSVVVAEDGQQVVTGHPDGRMTQWQRLYERIGAAFGISGFENAAKQPSTNMHWHPQAVRCMAFAPDGVQLLSGGEEGVLVQWNLSKGTRAYIPRLGAALKGLAVSPSQEYAVVTTADNAVSLVGLAVWDVLWQLRGLALTPVNGEETVRSNDKIVFRPKPLKLTLEPRRGLLVCNGRPGHLQFYNVSTNCLEASAEILHFNQDTSASGFVYFYGKKDDTGKGKDDGDGEDKPRVKTGKPLVEHVAFSRDGKRMVAVASRQQQQSRSGKAPSLSFWRLANGSDPYGGVYTGSYAGARSASGGRSSSHDTTKSKDGGGGEGGGIAKHWASDTTVENPHGLGTHVTALEYDPRRNVAVSAGEDGAFKLWGMKRNASTVETLAATAAAAAAVGRGGRGGKREEVSETHWACTLSIRYKAGLSASAVSFCSDGSVLAVSYTPKAAASTAGSGARAGDIFNHQQVSGVVALWSVETATLLSTLLPPRTSATGGPHALGFLSGTGRLFAAGAGYAAVWDLVSQQTNPVWQYRVGVRAAATADLASVHRSGAIGVEVPDRGFGDVALAIDAASLALAKGGSKRSRSAKGSVVLLLSAANPTPLYTWQLRRDVVTAVQLLLGREGSRQGVLALTRAGELLLLSVPCGTSGGSGPSRGQQADVGLGVVSMVRPGTAAAPGLQVAISGKRKLLAVDLTGSDPALAAVGKRTRAVGMEDSDDDEDDEDFGHSGGREAALHSTTRASDILDPSSINLAPVPDLYQAFMATLLKPAPKPPKTTNTTITPSAGRHSTTSRGDAVTPDGRRDMSTDTAAAHGAVKGNRRGGAGRAGKGKSRSSLGAWAGDRGAFSAPVDVDDALLAVLTTKLKAAGGDA